MFLISFTKYDDVVDENATQSLSTLKMSDVSLDLLVTTNDLSGSSAISANHSLI
jgi:hypothetical protein